MEGHVTEVVTLMEGELSLSEAASLGPGENTCYGGGQFNGGRSYVTRWHEQGRMTSCYRSGPFNGGIMACYRGDQFKWRENGHVTEVVSLMEGEWSCYRGGQFNGGRMVMI